MFAKYRENLQMLLADTYYKKVKIFIDFQNLY